MLHGSNFNEILDKLVDIKMAITATSLLIDRMFGSTMGFSGTADLTVQLLVSKNRRWQLAATLMAT